MEEFKDYPSLVDAVYIIVQGTPKDKEQIDITSIADALDIPWYSKACTFGITEAMGELVSLGYCRGYEEFDGHFRHISRSPDAPTIFPSAYPNPCAVDEPLPLRRKALQFIHTKTVCHESGITFYNRDIGIPVKDALHELLPGSSHNEAAVRELSVNIQDLVTSGLLAGVPFPNNFTLRPDGLLPNEIEFYLKRGDIFPPDNYLKDSHFFVRVIEKGMLMLWVTFRGAVCLKRTSSKSF
jgi:hypothetical protein